jgi:hypothetical protein
MAEVTLRRCDVFKTLTEEVQPIKVSMVTKEGLEIMGKTLDMSPRAIKRAKLFLGRATTPPPPLKAKPDA